MSNSMQEPPVDSRELPRLSVVLATPYDFESLGAVLRYLAAQTIRDQIELVLVGSTPDVFQVDACFLSGFHSFQVLHVGPIRSLNVPRAAAYRAAQAPVVALSEDHCFPAPTWAEALIRAHEGPWAAVGPAIGIANPERYLSWANYLIQYGAWVQPARSGVLDDLPGHNSSYKRDVLREFDEGLETIFIAEAALHSELRRHGYELYMEAAAVSHHVFITQLRPYVRENYHIGRQFASNRCRRLVACPPLLLRPRLSRGAVPADLADLPANARARLVPRPRAPDPALALARALRQRGRRTDGLRVRHRQLCGDDARARVRAGPVRLARATGADLGRGDRCLRRRSAAAGRLAGAEARRPTVPPGATRYVEIIFFS